MIDKQNELCVDLSVVGTAGEYLSTNVIDMGAAGSVVQGGTALNDMNASDVAHLYCRVTEAFNSDDAMTVRMQLIAANDTALTSGAVVLLDTGVLAYTVFALDYFPTALHGIVIPHNSKRYLGLKVTTADFDASYGMVTARVVVGRQNNPTNLL